MTNAFPASNRSSLAHSFLPPPSKHQQEESTILKLTAMKIKCLAEVLRKGMPWF